MNLTDWQRAEAQPGMFHFPSEANFPTASNHDARQYCAGCEHGEKVVAGGLPNRVRCTKMRRSLRDLGRKGEPKVIPAGTPGCKYWEKRR